MKNMILVYDDHCPLCTWYSAQFVNFGLLPVDGREAFSTLDPSRLQLIDFERGRNEIPLLDISSGKVVYGIDALLEILGQRFPFIKTAGNIYPVKWLLKILYKLISYNRKVIVAKKCGTGVIDCSPQFNFPYRVIFLGLFFIVNTFMLFPIHQHILHKLPVYRLTITELQLAHLMLVLINCLLASTLPAKKAIDYLGQVNMLALLCMLLLSPLLLVCTFFSPPAWSISIFLFLLFVFVFKEYRRRMDYAKMLRHKWLVGINITCLLIFLAWLFH